MFIIDKGGTGDGFLKQSNCDRYFKVWMTLVWAEGAAVSGPPPSSQLNGLKGRSRPPNWTDVFTYVTTEFPARPPPPRCPSTVSIWACSPHPGHTCRARCACPQWHRLQPPLRRHPGFWCQQASGRQSGLSTPAVGLGSALRPAAQEPRMPLLTALGHRAAFPTAEPIDFW